MTTTLTSQLAATFATLTFAQLADMLRDGYRPHFEITSKEIEDQETCLEVGMIVRIDGMSDEGDDLFRINVNLEDFDEINKSRLKANYYDANGSATLTAIQKGVYPKAGEHEHFYVGATALVSSMLTPVDSAESAIYAQFMATANGKSFLAWATERLNATKEHRIPDKERRQAISGALDTYILARFHARDGAVRTEAMEKDITDAEGALMSLVDAAIAGAPPMRLLTEAQRTGEVFLVNDTTTEKPYWVAAQWLSSPEWSGWVYDDEVLRDASPLGPQPTHYLVTPPAPAAPAGDAA